MLSLEDKIGQLLMIGFHGLEVPQFVIDLLEAGKIGGIILFARNVESPEQLAHLTATCHDAAKHPIMIAIDQEGGSVTRLYEKDGFTESPGAMVLGSANSEALTEEVSALLAQELRTLGINWNLAPVVDITNNINNPSVGTRSVGMEKKRVSQITAAQIRGYQSESVAASAKHFPGLGNTPIDTHEALAIIDDSLEDLWGRDLVPFRVAIKSRTATVMVSHVKFTQIDPEHPATLSSKVTNDLLRGEIGFSGVTCTDCMEMKAISNHYGAEESAVIAVLAGQDVVLSSHSFNQDSTLYERLYTTLLEATNSGRIPMERIDEANERIARLKARYAITTTPTTTNIGDAGRIAIMDDAARQGIALVHDDGGLLPILTDDSRAIGLVEFGSHLESGVMEAGGSTAFAEILQAKAPSIASVALKSTPDNNATVLEELQHIITDSDVVILATRNAHLNDAQLDIAKQVVDNAKQIILLCLRNPYDAGILKDVGTVICSCGDSRPSLRATADLLLGTFTPSGKLPVSLS